jgi:CubicO group peptidase (beta-lactamase class C family)
MKQFALRCLIAAAASMSLGAAATMADVAVTNPESVGFSTAGLNAYGQALQALVDERRLAGVSTLVARRGKVAMFDTYGYQDLDARKPLAKDTIFRIASMTKPIAGVAMMMLWEEGKWTLDDPVAKHIPEFRDLKVSSPNGPVPQAHPMTMRELMSHTAGFDVSRGYESVGLTDPRQPLQAMIDKLAKLPLPVQPGTDWRYGPVVNIQGYIVEKLSGQSLDAFLRTRIFEPLNMKDTGFWVEAAKAERVTRLYTYGPDKKIVTAPNQPDATRRPVFLSASGGLLSTVEDYWRFAQMLLNGGELEGARILKSTTVELMRTNVLNQGVQVDLYGPKEEGIGFGLDFAIVLDPVKANTPRGKNTFYWGGAFGTWFWIDPTNDVIVIGMIQNVNGSLPTGDTPPLRTLSPRMVYAALTDTTRLARDN